jgi:methylmalonyl-CoA/ethylmalonyl-CoA epimerase
VSEASAKGQPRLNHVGIAVRSLEEALAPYRDALGLQVSQIEEVVSEQVKVAFLPAGDTRIELLEPTGDASAIARFLSRRGEGVHHLCFEVDDIEAALARLRAAGVQLIDETPRPGAGGCRVAFVHPRGMAGVLVELLEKPRP